MISFPTVYELKPAFQRSLRSPVAWLAARHVTANQVTLAALAMSTGTGAAVALLLARGEVRALLLLPPVLLLRMALNAVDGMLAREHGHKSALGGILNELGDVLSDAALLLPFALLPAATPAMTSLVIAATVLAGATEVTGLAAKNEGASRRYDGPMGKSDRALVIGALAVVVGVGLAPPSAVTVVLAVVVCLVALTIAQRARAALDELSS